MLAGEPIVRADNQCRMSFANPARHFNNENSTACVLYLSP